MDRPVSDFYTIWCELGWRLSWQVSLPSVYRQIWFSSLHGRTRPQTGRFHLKRHPEGPCFSSPLPVGDTTNCYWPANQKLKKEGTLWPIPGFSCMKEEISGHPWEPCFSSMWHDHYHHHEFLSRIKRVHWGDRTLPKKLASGRARWASRPVCSLARLTCLHFSQ